MQHRCIGLIVEGALHAHVPKNKDPALNRVFKNSLVLHGGFEPSTLGLEVPCSIQLS